MPIQGLFKNVLQIKYSKGIYWVMSDPETREFPYSTEVEIEMPSEHWAEIVATSVGVEEEIHPEKAMRDISYEGKTIHAKFASSELKTLRVELSSFWSMAKLSSEVLNEFGSPNDLSKPDKYIH